MASIVVFGHLARFVPADSITNKVFIKIGLLDPVEAVICFLIISGFSIAHSYSSRPDGYFRRRALRIYPLYVVGVLLAIVPFSIPSPIIEIVGASVPSPAQLACNFALLQGFACHPIYTNGPLWTLSVEVACYVLAPLFFRLPRRALIALILTSAASYVALPRLHLDFYSRMQYGLPLLFLAWPWLLGFLFYFERDNFRYKAALIGLGPAMLVGNHVFNTKLGFVTYMASAIVIMTCNYARLSERALRLCNYLGDLSYPLYIVHTPVLLIASLLVTHANAPLFVTVALATAVASYHLIDKPIRSRRLVRFASATAAP